MTVQKVPTEQKEEGCESNHSRISQDIVGDHRAHEHDKRVCRKKGNVENNQEIQEGPAELQCFPHNGSVDGGLKSEERKVSNEARNCIRRGSIRVVGSLSHENETLLDEGRDGVVWREEEEADGEDEEADAVCDSLQVAFGAYEHGGHHEAHYGEDDKSWEEKLRRTVDVLEVSAHEYNGLGEEWINELWAQVFVRRHGVLVRNTVRGEIVVFIDGVVTALRCRSPW